MATGLPSLLRLRRELLGQTHVRTTMIYAHVSNRGGRGVDSGRPVGAGGAAVDHAAGTSRRRLTAAVVAAESRVGGGVSMLGKTNVEQ